TAYTQNGTEHITNTYNSLGQITEKQITDEKGDTAKHSYSYDSNNNLTSTRIEHPDYIVTLDQYGTQTSFEYGPRLKEAIRQAEEQAKLAEAQARKAQNKAKNAQKAAASKAMKKLMNKMAKQDQLNIELKQTMSKMALGRNAGRQAQQNAAKEKQTASKTLEKAKQELAKAKNIRAGFIRPASRGERKSGLTHQTPTYDLTSTRIIEKGNSVLLVDANGKTIKEYKASGNTVKVTDNIEGTKTNYTYGRYGLDKVRGYNIATGELVRKEDYSYKVSGGQVREVNYTKWAKDPKYIPTSEGDTAVNAKGEYFANGKTQYDAKGRVTFSEEASWFTGTSGKNLYQHYDKIENITYDKLNQMVSFHREASEHGMGIESYATVIDRVGMTDAQGRLSYYKETVNTKTDDAKITQIYEGKPEYGANNVLINEHREMTSEEVSNSFGFKQIFGIVLPVVLGILLAPVTAGISSALAGTIGQIGAQMVAHAVTGFISSFVTSMAMGANPMDALKGALITGGIAGIAAGANIIGGDLFGVEQATQNLSALDAAKNIFTTSTAISAARQVITRSIMTAVGDELGTVGTSVLGGALSAFSGPPQDIGKNIILGSIKGAAGGYISQALGSTTGAQFIGAAIGGITDAAIDRAGQEIQYQMAKIAYNHQARDALGNELIGGADIIAGGGAAYALKAQEPSKIEATTYRTNDKGWIIGAEVKRDDDKTAHYKLGNNGWQLDYVASENAELITTLQYNPVAGTLTNIPYTVEVIGSKIHENGATAYYDRLGNFKEAIPDNQIAIRDTNGTLIATKLPISMMTMGMGQDILFSPLTPSSEPPSLVQRGVGGVSLEGGQMLGQVPMGAEPIIQNGNLLGSARIEDNGTRTYYNTSGDVKYRLLPNAEFTISPLNKIVQYTTDLKGSNIYDLQGNQIQYIPPGATGTELNGNLVSYRRTQSPEGIIRVEWFDKNGISVPLDEALTILQTGLNSAANITVQAVEIGQGIYKGWMNGIKREIYAREMIRLKAENELIDRIAAIEQKEILTITGKELGKGVFAIHDLEKGLDSELPTIERVAGWLGFLGTNTLNVLTLGVRPAIKILESTRGVKAALGAVETTSQLGKTGTIIGAVKKTEEVIVTSRVTKTLTEGQELWKLQRSRIIEGLPKLTEGYNYKVFKDGRVLVSRNAGMTEKLPQLHLTKEGKLAEGASKGEIFKTKIPDVTSVGTGVKAEKLTETLLDAERLREQRLLKISRYVGGGINAFVNTVNESMKEDTTPTKMVVAAIMGGILGYVGNPASGFFHNVVSKAAAGGLVSGVGDVMTQGAQQLATKKRIDLTDIDWHRAGTATLGGTVANLWASSIMPKERNPVLHEAAKQTLKTPAKKFVNEMLESPGISRDLSTFYPLPLRSPAGKEYHPSLERPVQHEVETYREEEVREPSERPSLESEDKSFNPRK
ncbi:MAG: hypothetical protein HYS08_06160, partial [Chlamydiae bacterium]|nr:hypothetical protein [Chlamydiota bacterium]